MPVVPVLSIDVQELIARISNRIMQTDEIVAFTRTLVRETRHTIREYASGSERPDSLSYERLAAPEIAANCEPVQS